MESAVALANFLASLPTYVLIIFVIFGFLWIQNKQITIQNQQRQDAKDATDRSLRAVEESNRLNQQGQQILQKMSEVEAERVKAEAERVKAVHLTAESVAANTVATTALSTTLAPLAQSLPALVSGTNANIATLETVGKAQTLSGATAQDTSANVKEILALMIRRGVKLDDLAKEISAVAGDIKTLATYATAPTAAGKEAVKDIAASPVVAPAVDVPAASPTPQPGDEIQVTGTVTGTVALTAAAESVPA